MRRVFILVDNENIIRCIASEECNLHRDKLWMRKHYTEFRGIVGDEYDSHNDAWILRPENYPKPSKEELLEQKIQEEMDRILREQAIQNLKKNRSEI